MNDLVSRLCTGDHPVSVSLRPNSDIPTLRECLGRNYVHIKFTGTRGGTELGVRLDPSATDLSAADFESRSGSIRLVGGLKLDYVKVRCIAEIDLKTLEGKGHLEVAEEVN